MRKHARHLVLVTAALVAGIAASSHAAVTYDGFDYTGTALAGQDGGTNWGGPWFTTSGGNANSLSDDDTSLAYPASFQSPLTTPASVGGRISTGGLASPNASTSRLLGTTIDLSTDGNVFYASALFRKNAANGGGINNDNILIEFVDSNANRRFGLGIEGTGDKPWLNANASTTPASGPAVTPGDTYLIVARIVSSASGSDTTSLKVFGDGYASQVPADEPTTWDATLSETTSAILDRIRVRIDPGNTAAAPGEVDDIRVGTTWQDVVGAPVPEPSSLALLGLAGVAVLRRRRRGA